MLGCVGRKVGGGEYKKESGMRWVSHVMREKRRREGRKWWQQLNSQKNTTQKARFVLYCKRQCRTYFGIYTQLLWKHSN